MYTIYREGTLFTILFIRRNWIFLNFSYYIQCVATKLLKKSNEIKNYLNNIVNNTYIVYFIHFYVFLVYIEVYPLYR